jgi:hypothetical protein
VLLVHELGHFAAMRAFGYTDTKIFFVPFVGAATAGRKVGVPAWEEAIVLLMGPMPGLLAGTILLLAGAEGLARELAVIAVFVNAANLLPVEPLDGGRLITRTLFGRHPGLEALAGFAAGAALAWYGFVSRGWVLVAIGLVLMLFLPARARVASSAVHLSRRWPDVPVALSDAPEGYRYDLCMQAASLGNNAAARPIYHAVLIRRIHERVVKVPPGPVATVALLGAYAACVATAALAIVLAIHT